jgi:hypothetical protein
MLIWLFEKSDALSLSTVASPTPYPGYHVNLFKSATDADRQQHVRVSVHVVQICSATGIHPEHRKMEEKLRYSLSTACPRTARMRLDV